MRQRYFFALFIALFFAFFELNCGGGTLAASKSNSNVSPGQTPANSGDPAAGTSNGPSTGNGSLGGATGGSNSGNSGSGSGGSGSGSDTQGTTMSNLHQQSGWQSYGELPPSYSLCDSCSPGGPNVTWSMQLGVTSPSMSGNSTAFAIGGQENYADVIWINHLIGQGSTQSLPDPDGTLNAATHNFIYDVYFYGTDLTKAQALEFDINQFVDGKSFVWGHQCRVANGANWWDISINNGQDWQPSSAACNPKENAWNHLTIQVQRTSDDKLLFQSITLNGNTTTLNHQEDPGSTDWKGITINYQQDGDYAQHPYTVWLDQLNFTYW